MRSRQDEIVCAFNHGERNRKEAWTEHAESCHEGRWCERRAVNGGERIGYPEIFARLGETAVELIAFQKALLMAAAVDCMPCMRKRFTDGKAFCIRKNALRRSCARHCPRIRADDISGADSRETVLIEGGNRDMIQSGRDKRNFESIQSVSEQLLKVTGRDILVSADLNQLLEQRHTGSPDLSVCRRVRKPPICIGCRPPYLECLWYFECCKEVIECTRALICRALRAAKDLRQDGERRSNASTYHIERNLFGDPRRVLCVVLLLFRNGAAHKVPFIRCRPLML